MLTGCVLIFLESGKRRFELDFARQVFGFLRTSSEVKDRERVPATRARVLHELLPQAQRQVHRPPEQEDLRRQALHRLRLPALRPVLYRRKHAQRPDCQEVPGHCRADGRSACRALQGGPRPHRHAHSLLHDETLQVHRGRVHRLAQNLPTRLGHRSTAEFSRRVTFFFLWIS
jgi:hypothetical protein